MDVKIEESWKEKLFDEFRKPYFRDLTNFVKEEYAHRTIYPPGKMIFNAFNNCPLRDIRVVIIGQDPYHGPGQANGLCFSVADGVRHPPSLVNIFKELKDDLGISPPNSGNLERWAKQGVLMLNATLTVRASQAGSHQNKGWEKFTDAVIQLINDEKQDVAFILWGAYAQRKGSMINSLKHFVVKSAHPSPFSAHNGFLGSKPFSQVNGYLTARGKGEINW